MPNTNPYLCLVNNVAICNLENLKTDAEGRNTENIYMLHAATLVRIADKVDCFTNKCDENQFVLSLDL